MSPPIHPLASSQGAVFLVNSCQRNFRCVPLRSSLRSELRRDTAPHQKWKATSTEALWGAKSEGGKPYPEVTAAVLPISLGTTHSFVLVYSTWSPVLVCGTDSIFLSLEIFLGSALCIIIHPRTGRLFASLGCAIKGNVRIFLYNILKKQTSNPIMSDTYCSPSSRHKIQKCGNINPLSIEYGFRHSLRPD